MTQRHEQHRRSAFTLLEVVLAVSLSVVLLGALYVALTMNYFQTRAGRDLIDETVLTRTIAERISQDLVGQLPPIDTRIIPQGQPVSSSQTPQNGTSGTSGSGSSSSGSGGSNSSGGTGASMSGNSGGAASGSTGGGNSSSGGSNSNMSGNSTNSGNSSNSSGSSGSNTPGAVAVSNFQVYGNESSLVITSRGVPQDLTMQPNSTPTLTCDQRRVTYWLAGGSGLARLVTTQATNGDAFSYPPSVPPSVGDPTPYIIAHEVKSLTFEYFDGTNWNNSWDGSMLDPSGNTQQPMGPPAAIAFTIVLSLPAHPTGTGPKTRDVTYRHVVPLQTANNFTQASANNAAGSSAGGPGSGASASGGSPSGASASGANGGMSSPNGR